MLSETDKGNLERCLAHIIAALGRCIQDLKNPKDALAAKTTEKQLFNDSDDDVLSMDGHLNTGIHKYTLDNTEIDLLDKLTKNIEAILRECFRDLTAICSNSFAAYLHQYNYDLKEKKFSARLTKDVLPSMRQELKGLFESSKAFTAAATGQQTDVKEFIEKNPSFKNTPSLWGTTLLYTAALNNQFEIVKYLVEEAQCAVNARNLFNMQKNPSSAVTNTLNLTLGSTALHGACSSNGHLKIVEYLVKEKNADYFIKNQEKKTPIEYGEKYSDIKRFFQDYLLISYSTPSSANLPNKPIMDDVRPQRDCIWEYKPLQKREWHQFPDDQAQTLQQALIPSKNLQGQIELKKPEGLFNVSMAEFLQSDKNYPNSPEKQAWIRCRGSSVLNFDMQANWQLMFIQYPKATGTTTSLLTVSHLTAIFYSNFDVELNKWYMCDTRTNLVLNDSMNLRRKVVVINIPLGMSDKPLVCNLNAFKFVNDDKTVIGYLRWIPQSISRDERNKNKMNEVDNVQLKTNVEHPSNGISYNKQESDNEEVDMRSRYDNNDDDDDDDGIIITKKKVSTDSNGVFSMNDLMNEEPSKTPVSIDTDTNTPPEYVQPSKPIHSEMSEDEKQKIKELTDRINKLQKELDEKIEYEKNLKEFEKKITTEKNYITKPFEAIPTYLYVKGQSITKHLNDKQKLPDYYIDKIPKVFFHEDDSKYSASLTGLQTHHHEFELLLQRISYLSYQTQRIQYDYKKQVNQMAESVITIITKKIRSSQNWKHYTKYFSEILKDKKQEHIEHFNEYITSKSKLLTDEAISNSNFKPETELKNNLEDYKKSKSFTVEIEKIKHEALAEFIKQQIYLPERQFEKKPSKESIKVLNDFIERKKKEMNTEQIYKGLDVKQFKLITELLKAISLYYNCFQLQLPLFEFAPKLLKNIDQNTVITISTSTGSGKSTLLPALLIAEGYDRVLVTQPRRLPCTSICERVNSTMTSNEDSERIAGWAVSGAECDVNSPILYQTDGLLEEQLLHDENLITDQTKLNKSVVFFIDEVHERSINIDLCLALLAELLTKKPHLKSKMKVIISSATLDESVPSLFRQINQLKFAEFTMPSLGTLYPVTRHERPDVNIIALVQELNKKRQRNEQILCFASSVADVHLGCRLLQDVSSGSIIAYPLVQSQSATEQQMYIEQGSIFFSTTVAETSLTFPTLRYVIDTGMINTPVYDSNTQQTVLKKVRAAESTIKQRLGRLGRTQPGDYYALYDFKVDEKKFPTPQICQSELTDIELSLRKAPTQKSLNEMKKFLPDKPSPQAIGMALEKLRRFGVITLPPNEHFTNDGVGIAKIPDFYSVELSKAVYYALTRYKCGRDMIIISSILGVLNTSAVLTFLPERFKSPDGDFMTLLNVMNEVLDAKQSIPARPFNLKQFCDQKGLTNVYHILNQACRRYKTLEKSFSVSKDYRSQAQVQSGDWELIAQALLKGFSDNVFVSLKELQGRTHQYTRYQSSKTDIDVAILDRQSTLSRSITSAPVSLIVVRDIRYSSSVRAMAVLSFIGEIKPSWIKYKVERKLHLNDKEKEKLFDEKILSIAQQQFPDVEFPLSQHVLSIKGRSGSVLNAELFILQKLVEERKFSFTTNLSENSEEYATLKRNLEGIFKMTHIFNPMKWRWENQEQVKITVQQSPTAELEITVRGRNSKNVLVQQEFLMLFYWLQNCLVIRTPNSGLPPRLLIPQVRPKYIDFEERISHVTDSKRTLIDLWNGLQGPKATRETRMEVVAWIAVCKFGCKLEGGFVRDWIVGNDRSKPTGQHADPSTWVSYKTNSAKVQVPTMHPGVIPADLDCHLPLYAYFDIDKFLDFMHKFQIECKVFRENWRYILLLDEATKTGPFIMELIEPHVALTHDRIDFDVSNLSVEKNYTKELGMRVDIEQEPYSITLEKIVDGIRNKRLRVLRPIDDFLDDRIKKMRDIRGWSIINQSMYFIPKPPGKYPAILAPWPSSFDLYKKVVEKIEKTIPNVEVLKIEQLRNPALEQLYYGMKKWIQSQCEDGNANEKELFHGTTGEGIDGIRNYGYDDRYSGSTTTNGGDWGHGLYFAANPGVHPHGHTKPDDQSQTRILYYSKVLLGKVYDMNSINRELQSPPIGYHSVHGIHPNRPDDDEYIVYQNGQALPYLKITYKV